MVDPWELATMPYIYMYRNLYILYHLLSQQLFQCTCLCWNQFSKWCCVGVYYSSTALYFLSVGFMVRRGHAGHVFILHKKFCPPPFSCTKISDPPLFPPDAPPSPVINDRSLHKYKTFSVLILYQHEWKLGKRKIVWKHNFEFSQFQRVLILNCISIRKKCFIFVKYRIYK
jgi:hypothetical protein